VPILAHFGKDEIKTSIAFLKWKSFFVFYGQLLILKIRSIIKYFLGPKEVFDDRPIKSEGGTKKWERNDCLASSPIAGIKMQLPA
jgi:hypothetical protein